MLPDLTVLIALLLGLMSREGGPSEDPARALLGTALCVLVGASLSRLALARGLRALAEDEPLQAEASLRWTVTWPLLAWFTCLELFGWGGWVAHAIPRVWWMASFLVLFLPALVLFAVGWASRAQLQARIIVQRGGVPQPIGPLPAIVRELKRNLLIFIPMLFLIGLTEAAWVAGELGVEPLRTFSLWLEAMPLLNLGLILVLLLLLLPFLPSIFARALKAEPLEPGPLRDTLERCAESIDLKYKDIMLWRTGGRVFNAMVVGFTPGTRMIFLTDGLLNVMPEEEIIAVFFHEAGHAKRQHLLLFLVSFFSLALLLDAASGPLLALGVPVVMQIILHLVILWFGLLGWVSRRFERESDIYGATHASVLEPEAPAIVVPGLPAPLPRGAALMMRALERIRSIAGRGGSHRHGTIEERVTYVASYATDPATKRSFESGRRGLLIGLMLLLGLALAATILRMPTQVALAEADVESRTALVTYRETWKLAHTSKGVDRAQVRAKYEKAYTGFAAAGQRLEGLSDPTSHLLRIQHVYNAADVALHGLSDRARARAGFEQTLRLMEELPPGERRGWYVSLLAFNSHVELGRLAAWEYGDLPEGSEDRDLGETLDHTLAARVLKEQTLDNARGLSARTRALLGERLRLLDATYEAARGETAEARRALVKLAQIGGDRDAGAAEKWKDREAVEIAEDAQAELDRLDR